MRAGARHLLWCILGSQGAKHAALASQLWPQPLPPRTPAPHEVLCRTVYLSVDPFLRCRFNASTGVDYTQPYALGEPIASAGIGEVLQVGDAVRGPAPGDLVVEPFDSFPWQSVAVLEAAKVQRVPPLLALLLPPSALLGACGQTGLTAWCGLETVGGGRPNGSDVVAVSGAAGAVGSLVGQLCKRRGAAVVGVCGSEAKVDFLQELGFDRALNRHSADLRADLRAALLSVPQADRALGTSRSPQPVDITLYWDNVGGAVSDLVIQCMAPRSELLLCGQISTYDAEGDYPPPLPAESAAVVERRRIRRERYTVVKYKHRFAPALAELCALVAAEARRRGRRDAAPELRAEETVYDGLDAAPAAFIDMMGGGNTGKAVVRCSELPPPVARAAALRAWLPPALRGRLVRSFVTPEALGVG
ncbi:prostaglandin reductase-like protein [Emiliania huxleyi CCMP1516]|uniref:Enoyl reductase (ER) domain-containing protein n=2 Tax=Emiliania huxleyi TaxID=2903 RepID=A0A0D3JSZ8_EMIH1|nr:prostaglandin reductase-like protein [Emiliania huxleyi CCMP1516]EOD26633.1 prostaglandin reductase-like protein [Emiliania huxleyi CCMP1516]|eukprot:XP_005779062.1 prostaglandin reductase-like protein [Emiliania huxleyi CCMP1516]